MELVFYKGLRGITFIAGGIFRKNLALGALYTNVHPNIIQTRKQMLHTSIAVLEHGVWGWSFEMFPRVWGLGSRHFQNLKFYKSILKLSQKGKNGTLFLLYLYICIGKPNTGRPHFIELFFIALCRYYGGWGVCFCLFTYWRFMATLHRTSYQHHFSNSIGLLCSSSCFIITIFVTVIHDQWSLTVLQKITTHWRSWCLAFVAIKYFVIKIHTLFFRHNAIAHVTDYRIV